MCAEATEEKSFMTCKFEEGQILFISMGAYSDYSVISHVVVIKDFTNTEVANRWRTELFLQETGRDPYDYIPAIHDEFVAWLLKRGYVKLLPPGSVQEWHIGDYGRLNL